MFLAATAGSERRRNIYNDIDQTLGLVMGADL
jgi:hypothetical protein